MGNGTDHEQLAQAMDRLGGALRNWLAERRGTVEEVERSIDQVEAAAAAVGRLAPTIWDALQALEFAEDTLWHQYERLIEEGHLAVAERIASTFERMCPDEGSVELARVRALRGDREGPIELLGTAALDRERAPFCRSGALIYLSALSPEVFARVAPEALRRALAAGDPREARWIVEALDLALWEAEPSENDEAGAEIIPFPKPAPSPDLRN